MIIAFSLLVLGVLTGAAPFFFAALIAPFDLILWIIAGLLILGGIVKLIWPKTKTPAG